MLRIYLFVLLFHVALFSHETATFSFISVPQTEDALPPWFLESLILSHVEKKEEKLIYHKNEIMHKLQTLSCIESVSLEETEDGKLVIYHKLRKPIIALRQKLEQPPFYQIFGWDKEGNCFSMTPFYSPKQLPYLIIPKKWKGSQEEIQEIIVCVKALQNFFNNSEIYRGEVQFFDISKMNHNFCFFQREAIVQLEITMKQEKSQKHIFFLRFDPKEMKRKIELLFSKALNYAMKEREEKSEKYSILDMRYEDFCLFSTID